MPPASSTGDTRRHAVAFIAGLVLFATLIAIGWPHPVQFSVRALLHPLAPNRPIAGVAGDYVLADPVPGHEGDLILMATSGARRIEIHLLDRGHWAEAIHTPSFDVAYEGLGTNAPPGDVAAVMGAVIAAVEANDPGHLRVADLARRAETPTALQRILDRFVATRGFVAGVLLVTLCAVLAQSSIGFATLALLLGGLGLWLRATSLDLPFSMDADVQRLFTAHLPLRDLVSTAALHDRHPPFMFLLLHAMQRFGESETVVRLPAVIAGALIGPAILAAARWARDRTSASQSAAIAATAACAALVATASPVLVDRSREVSELALFGLLAVVTLSAAIRASRRPTAPALWLVALGHALLFWTYYLAAFLLLGFWLAMRAMGRIDRRLVRAAALGTLFGLPSLGLAGLTLLRDYPIRQTARIFPQIVWGERSAAMMAGEVGPIVLSALGEPLVVLIALLGVAALLRRDRAVFAPIAAATAVGAGMLLLVGPARIQAYYIVSVVPLLTLALALFDMPTARRWEWAIATLVALATAATVPRLLAAGADRIYAPDSSAFGRRFAEVIRTRPESQIAVTFAPDCTLLAYNLARAAGVDIDWRDLDDDQTGIALTGMRQRLAPLLRPTALGEDPGPRATAQLENLAAQGDFLAVDAAVPANAAVAAWLERCAELDRTAVRRLLHCAKTP